MVEHEDHKYYGLVT